MLSKATRSVWDLSDFFLSLSISLCLALIFIRSFHLLTFRKQQQQQPIYRREQSKFRLCRFNATGCRLLKLLLQLFSRSFNPAEVLWCRFFFHFQNRDYITNWFHLFWVIVLGFNQTSSNLSTIYLGGMNVCVCAGYFSAIYRSLNYFILYKINVAEKQSTRIRHFSFFSSTQFLYLKLNVFSNCYWTISNRRPTTITLAVVVVTFTDTQYKQCINYPFASISKESVFSCFVC